MAAFKSLTEQYVSSRLIAVCRKAFSMFSEANRVKLDRGIVMCGVMRLYVSWLEKKFPTIMVQVELF